MSIIAHQEIRNAIEREAGDVVQANTLPLVLNIVDRILSEYEITKIPTQDCGHDYLLDAFLQAKESEGKSEKTIIRYKYIITRMLESLGMTSINITAYHIRKYLTDEKARGISDSTLKGDRDIFNSYFGWLYRDSLIQRNPMANICSIKCQKKVKEVFSDVDIERLKEGCHSIRDKAILYFLKSTGCRIGEVTNLNREDVDMFRAECIVLGKGNKQRTVYLDDVAVMFIKQYLESRKDDNEALFVGRRGTRLTTNGIRRMLKKLGESTGVKHVHPHKFRRTEITNLVKKGMPIEQVRILAGHDKIDTTIGYVVLDDRTIKNSYHKYA